MPIPSEYQRATELFYKFLSDVKESSGLESSHQAYTMTQGVLQTFRRRLSLEESIRFANALPVVLRAIFVSDWDVSEPVRPFEDVNVMTAEVRELRSEHNFSTDSAISDVARALRKNIDEAAFDRVLAGLPEGAVRFWQQ